MNAVEQIKYDLALANRMMANEGVLDTFGHISARHPERPDRYFLSRSRAPELIEPSDLVEYDLDSVAVGGSTLAPYSERVIHGEIFRARPDVMAVCHHHAAAFMPLVITGTDYVPVVHLGSVGGYKPPFWDQRAEFGDTNYLVVKAEEGRALARALGNHMMVLMNRHGVTAVGTNLSDLVFRCVYSCRNAEFQVQAAASGKIDPLSKGDIDFGSRIGGTTTGHTRAWEHWTVRLQRSNWLPPRS
jgi:HCOMODA/2-hydroxy-3-carboxy-muconic semialdehyde decarboxylase